MYIFTKKNESLITVKKNPALSLFLGTNYFFGGVAPLMTITGVAGRHFHAAPKICLPALTPDPTIRRALPAPRAHPRLTNIVPR